MKQELRCHAVLCPSESKARAMAQRLQERLRQALVDFRREKISRQNARLSLANSVYENPSMPYRKILLHTGTSNYRPPHERGKSAPKLKAIEEEDSFVEEDDVEEHEDGGHEEEEGYLAAMPTSSSSPSLATARGLPEPSTEVTSLASFGPDVGMLVDLEDEEEGEGGKEQRPSFVPMDRREVGGLNEEVSRRLVATFDEDEDDDDDEEEDEVIDYLQAKGGEEVVKVVQGESICDKIAALGHCDSEEVDSAAPVSPESNRLSTRSSSVRSKGLPEEPPPPPPPCAPPSTATVASSVSSTPRQALDSAHDADSIEEEEEEAASSARLSEQDAISDESGYSEESNPGSSIAGGRRTSQTRKEEAHSGKTTVVNLNASSLPRPKKNSQTSKEKAAGQETLPPPVRAESPIQCDLTVHSAAHLMAASSSSEAPASASGGVDFLQNRVAEFCINI